MRARSFRPGPLLMLAAVLLFAAPRLAVAIPILDAGWEVDPLLDPANPASDRIVEANGFNEDGPYVYNLVTPALFRITDQFIVGDVWTVYDFNVPILTTAFVGFAAGFGDNASADAGWTSAAYSSGQVLLGAGAHSITVSGDGAGGIPARFFVRIDTVPEPGTMSLLGLGLFLYGVRRRGRRGV